MTPRALTVIGIGQCVNWGVLYYAFGVLLLPVAHDLHLAPWIVAGAFSLALLASAAAAPPVGRWVDRGHGPAVMQTGGLAAACLLALWAARPSVWTLHLIWAALGFCMAAVLYEPAFGIVGRAVGDATDRLQALATITVFGGLASTCFLPLTGVLVARVGWRETVWILAALMALVTAVVRVVAFPTTSSAYAFVQDVRGATRATRAAAARLAAQHESLGRLLVLFFATTLAAAAFATNLVPALIDRGMPPARSATIGGLIGLMQLPGRVALMNRSISAGPWRLLLVSVVLQAAGFALLIVARAVVPVAVAVALFAGGAGLSTLVRPYLVLAMVGPDRAGRLNGLIARQQQLARAGGPVVAAAGAAVAGYSVVFAGFALALGLLAITVRVAPVDSQGDTAVRSA